MLRSQSGCTQNVIGGYIGRKMIQSPQFTQDVPTGFQVTSPPVSVSRSPLWSSPLPTSPPARITNRLRWNPRTGAHLPLFLLVSPISLPTHCQDPLAQAFFPLFLVISLDTARALAPELVSFSHHQTLPARTLPSSWFPFSLACAVDKLVSTLLELFHTSWFHSPLACITS